jgi:RHS repeat-associated protein
VTPGVEELVQLRADDFGWCGGSAYRELVDDDLVGGAAGAVEHAVRCGPGLQRPHPDHQRQDQFTYDRNRLASSSTGGATSTFNYDPFGRLDTTTNGTGAIVERNVYDGFDHIIENRKTAGGVTATTRYTFDPLDRTTSETTHVGAANQKVTNFTYLGLSTEVLDENVAGTVTKSYQYSPWGERLSQTIHKDDGTTEDGYYGYNPHGDVDQVTDQGGDTKATYGYTAYGGDDTDLFTGIDKPDTADPTKEPFNVYRYNAKRFDPAAGTYDMGFRDYNPGLNRFLIRDTYNGALADLNLGLNPFTGNRYAFAGGNPTTNIELDGHVPCEGALTCGGSGEHCGAKGCDTNSGGDGNTGCGSANACERHIKHSLPPIIDAETGLCVASCKVINDAVDEYYRVNHCQGYTVSNFLGVVGLSPCGKSREEVQRALLEQVAHAQLADDGPEMTLPFIQGPDAPNNEEIAQRIARHIGDDTKAHGFGKLSTDEVAVQIESLLNRCSAGDKDLLTKTLRAGEPDEALVVYDQATKLMVVVNPSAPGYGTALTRSIEQYYNFGP